jgi:hypothetical protein
MDLNSVERIQEYSSIDSEKFQFSNPSDNKSIIPTLLLRLFRSGFFPIEANVCGSLLENSRLTEPTTNGLEYWPSEGKLSFQDITLQYKTASKPVLK